MVHLLIFSPNYTALYCRSVRVYIPRLRIHYHLAVVWTIKLRRGVRHLRSQEQRDITITSHGQTRNVFAAPRPTGRRAYNVSTITHRVHGGRTRVQREGSAFDGGRQPIPMRRDVEALVRPRNYGGLRPYGFPSIQQECMLRGQAAKGKAPSWGSSRRVDREQRTPTIDE